MCQRPAFSRERLLEIWRKLQQRRAKMRPANSHSSEANDSDIQAVRDCVLIFLQHHPNDVDALNEAMLPFAYLTLLRAPQSSKSGSVSSTDSESPIRSHQAGASPNNTTGGSCANDDGSSTVSSDHEVDGTPTNHARNMQATERTARNSHVPSTSGLEHGGDVSMAQNERLRKRGETVTRLDSMRAVQASDNPNQAKGVKRLQTTKQSALARTGEKPRLEKAKQKSRVKRRKLGASHTVSQQRVTPEQSTRQTDEEIRLLDSAPSNSQWIELRPPSLTSGVLINGGFHMGELDRVVSTWMEDPEVTCVLQDKTLGRYQQPKQELVSYLNLIASIGTIEVVRSFAVGVIQLMRNARFSFEVPAAPTHLRNVEYADIMQCFWRAAYRTRVNASLVSFGVILHRRSLATQRYCYLKAMTAIKATMERKGDPGYTKTAIARSILLDTIFPGSDKEELKRMSDRLKNDVSRARNYCRLIEYYGSSGILALLPHALTDTKMRDFTDAEFGLFLTLLGRLRPDLDRERTTKDAVDVGEYSRMRLCGRIIDMTHSGLRPHENDFDMLQKETNIILPQTKSILPGYQNIPSANDVDEIMRSAPDQITHAGREWETEHSRLAVLAQAVSSHIWEEGDLDTCGPSKTQDSGGRLQEST